jgi:hypothetical protein
MPTSPDPNPPEPGSATDPFPIPDDGYNDRWSLPTRIAFRFAFCYLGGYCLVSGNATIWSCIPVASDRIQDMLSRMFTLPAQYLAGHLFHVTPPGNHLHPTGSGDTAIFWIACLLLLLVSFVITAIWSALDRRRPNYQTLAAWLRFLIRLTLAVGMVTYGLAKVFPLQMPAPTIDSLSEPLGMHSPMSLLWNFIGVNPWYETVCGAAELLAGLLLLFRRTALAGALFTVFVVANVLLYNLAFDVPVKLYAGHLLLLALFVILPDARALFRFFWHHEPSRPTGVWVPPTTRPAFRRATIAFEAIFAVLILGGATFETGRDWLENRAPQSMKCPLCGDWHIDSANLIDATGKPVASPPRTKKGYMATDLVIYSPAEAIFRDSSGDKLYLHYAPDRKAQNIEIDVPGRPGTLYAFQSPDLTHIVLTPLGDAAKTKATLQLTLLTPTAGYPLVTRGFHWISEYPYQH